MLHHLNELQLFSVVAEEKSFTRAAARLNTSQSAISQSIKNLEDRLGVKLLARTTRSVTVTQAGAYLLTIIQPAIAEMVYGIEQISGLGANPVGTLRISADEYAINSVMTPILKPILDTYPSINIELIADYGLIDIVKSGYDAGIRRGNLVAKDMIAVQISEPTTMVTVSSPNYIQQHGIPDSPKALISHRCIHLRLPTHGEIFRWLYQIDGLKQTIKVESRLIYSSLLLIVEAVKQDLGIGYLPLNLVQEAIETGELVEILKDYRYTFEPYYLYYPHRREQTPLLNILVETIKARKLSK